jgi:hypothetical protein
LRNDPWIEVNRQIYPKSEAGERKTRKKKTGMWIEKDS